MQPLKPLYQKVDRCIRLLEELNTQVRDIRRKSAAFERAQEALKADMAKTREAELAELAATLLAEKPSAPVAEAPRDEAPNVPETPSTEPIAARPPQPEIKRGYNIDKYGRVYTEEEIQSIIAD